MIYPGRMVHDHNSCKRIIVNTNIERPFSYGVDPQNSIGTLSSANHSLFFILGNCILNEWVCQWSHRAYIFPM